MSIEKLPTSASLKQVMDKFEEISFSDFSSIDIIAVSSLPDTVKENKIVIITDNPTDNIVASYFDKDASTESGSIFIKLTTEERENSLKIISKNKKIISNVSYISQLGGENRMDSFIGKNGEWIPFTTKSLIVFKDGAYQNESVTGAFKSTTNPVVNCVIKNGVLDFYNYQAYDDMNSTKIAKTNAINLSNYNTIEFKVQSFNNHESLSYFIGVGNRLAFSKVAQGGASYCIDISNINTSEYIFVNIQRSTYYGQVDASIMISEISLY